MSVITISSLEEIDEKLDGLSKLSSESLEKLGFDPGDALTTIFRLKFKPVGMHPISGHALNFIEQVNQTWTYYCAFLACRKLISLHPDVKKWFLAPGAHAAQALDIMSDQDGAVGAETFAAVDPKNNKKLESDIAKLEEKKDQFEFRYVFFLSPKYPEMQRLEVRNGIEVWSLYLSYEKHCP